MPGCTSGPSLGTPILQPLLYTLQSVNVITGCYSHAWHNAPEMSEAGALASLVFSTGPQAPWVWGQHRVGQEAKTPQFSSEFLAESLALGFWENFIMMHNNSMPVSRAAQAHNVSCAKGLPCPWKRWC